MRIINNTASHITFTDFDRGNLGESKGVYEFTNSKADSGVEGGSFIDIYDTEDVLLSADLGQIKKYKDAGWIDTRYSCVSENNNYFSITTGVNDTFKFSIEGEGDYSVTLSSGTLTTDEVVLAISNSASAAGFNAESVRFFRSSYQDDVVPGEVDGGLGTGMGQRTEGRIDNFIALVCTKKITIGDGNANATLGFHKGDFTKVG